MKITKEMKTGATIGGIYGAIASYMPMLGFLTYPLWLVLVSFTEAYVGIEMVGPWTCKLTNGMSFLCEIPFVVYAIVFYALVGMIITHLFGKQIKKEEVIE